MLVPIIILHVFICVFLVFVILLQPGKSDGGIGFGSSSQSIFGSRGAGNFLTKTTSVCAFIFLATSFYLTRSRMAEYHKSVISAESQPVPAAPKNEKVEKASSANTGAAPAPATTKGESQKTEGQNKGAKAGGG